MLAYLRSEPGALTAGRESPLEASVRLLNESLDAYRSGDPARAHQLAVTSYLEGFELAEAPLDMVDRGLRMRVEAEMLRYRILIQSHAPREALETQAASILTLLDTARQRLDTARCRPPDLHQRALILLRRSRGDPGAGRPDQRP